MLHVRVVSPADRTGEVEEALLDCPAVTNVAVLPGAARRPSGDLVLCDVAREGANAVLDTLRGLGLEENGSIAVERVDLSVSRGAEEAQRAAPGYGDDAVIWEELDRRTIEETRVTWAYLAFLAIATQIAAIGVLVPSTILIVGAMVLGPEFGAVSAICFGLLRRDWPRIAAAARTLVIGFAAAIAVTFLCAIVSRWLGWIDPSWLDLNKEMEFIVKPDRWSFIVALLAGTAGVLSITAGRSSALVGVFISVTTVPAAGNIAVGLALSHLGEVWGSLAQLGVNLAGMILAGTATLAVQRVAWRKYGFRLPGPTRRSVTGPRREP
ncbi:DUF389 domain-containing protein [Bailinhaonella thermotolerans]|uniref:DUF389 domain-containing protein n=1 Tax=Bailinhaonella thermotolerans TaxID=1070861 RepID=A0A3A4A9H6_9ACTN|nr:DUF389 domain-containing protein [Bailinhaonella thermotolerans]RJL23557.1 DUF389 domain-containing protein [Bailinhaonella thermotolerans]